MDIQRTHDTAHRRPAERAWTRSPEIRVRGQVRGRCPAVRGAPIIRAIRVIQVGRRAWRFCGGATSGRRHRCRYSTSGSGRCCSVAPLTLAEARAGGSIGARRRRHSVRSLATLAKRSQPVRAQRSQPARPTAAHPDSTGKHQQRPIRDSPSRGSRMNEGRARGRMVRG